MIDTSLGLLPLAMYASMVLMLGRWVGLCARTPYDEKRAGGQLGLREAIVVAGVLFSLWCVAGAELLSFPHAIARGPLVIWWGVPALIGWFFILRHWHRRREATSVPRNERDRPARALAPLGAWMPIVAAAALITLAGVVALFSSPNTFDAMRYHLPRQVGWMQQGSVEHLTVRDPNQLSLPPLAEFIGLHLMVLSGGDFYATLVQWFALVLAAIAASLVARELGGRALAQSMAAFLVVSNPMTWLQASSAKNDVVAALWVLVVAWVVARTMRIGSLELRWSLVLGAAVGLGLLTKVTTVVFAFPLLVVLGVWLVWSRRHACIGPIAAVAAVALLVNAGHFSRNTRMYGSPTGTSAITFKGRPLSNETHSPAALVSNVVKNVALHAGTPWPRMNAEIHRSVVRIHALIGWDLHDERTSAYRPLRVMWSQRQEETAAAPFHVLLLVGAMLGMPFVLCRSMRTRGTGSRAPARLLRRGFLDQNSSPYTSPDSARCADALRTAVFLWASLAGFLLFCLLLKWQPWHARLHVGMFALVAPVTAVVLARGRGIGAIPVVLALLTLLIPTVLWNDSRPIAGNRSVLWSARQDMLIRRSDCQTGHAEVIDLVRSADARTVGLVLHRQGTYSIQRRLLEIERPPLMTDPFAPRERQADWTGPIPEIIITDGRNRPRLTHIPTGTVLYKVADAGAYQVFAQQAIAEQLLATRNATNPPATPIAAR